MPQVGVTTAESEQRRNRAGESEAEMRATYADEDFPRRILIFHAS